MDCSETSWLTNKEYFKLLNTKAVERRIPVYGSLNLTHTCNLRCVHCYLGGESGKGEEPARELDGDQWIKLIDEITEAGCLFLLITGGEPLLRKDFSRIYRHAREKGLLVAVFTNGTLVTDEILELFRELPPRVVEISLYGATASVYESITGVKGSYEKCIRGFRLLRENNINVKLKTVLMTLNRHEFFDIENIAKESGVKFRFDAAIFPRFNGDKTPLALRVPPEEVIEIESSNEEFVQRIISFYQRLGNAPVKDNMYICGAGRAGFHIDSHGFLKPCLMTSRYRFNLMNGSFLQGWNESIPQILKKKVKVGESRQCNTCSRRLLCGYCPAFFDLENDSEELPSAYLCRIGNLRFKSISDKIAKGAQNERKRTKTYIAATI